MPGGMPGGFPFPGMGGGGHAHGGGRPRGEKVRELDFERAAAEHGQQLQHLASAAAWSPHLFSSQERLQPSAGSCRLTSLSAGQPPASSGQHQGNHGSHVFHVASSVTALWPSRCWSLHVWCM